MLIESSLCICLQVGWANSSLRRLHELPPKNGRCASACTPSCKVGFVELDCHSATEPP